MENQEPQVHEEKQTHEKAVQEPKEHGSESHHEKNSKKFKIADQKMTTWISIAILVVAIAGSYWYKAGRKDIGAEGAKKKVVEFVKGNLVQPGTEVEAKDAVKENGLYKVTIDVQNQEIPTYITVDGKTFFPQGIETETKTDNKQAKEVEQKEIPKSDKPTVDLFVMSYCPYGLQMEKGILPVVEALGNKIDFKLKFVSYTLHGQKEVDENTRQYCIQKNQPNKLDDYLKCFWNKSSGESAACMKSAGINATQVQTCMAETTKKFNLTEKDYGTEKDENKKFGVQGSPTLVINGVVSNAGRDPKSIQQAICGAFNNAPAECKKELSSTSPAAGFDDQNSGGGAASGGAAAGGAAGACH